MLTIDGNTTVRELLTEHPNAFDVLVSHGMCQDCKDNPPPVPLEHFARKHCDGDLKNLIGQLEAAVQHDDSPSTDQCLSPGETDMPTRPKTCPDCSRALTAIQIIDKKGLGMPPHGILEYAVSEAARSFWTGQFPVEGSVHSFMCDVCGRVLLYAGAND